MAAFFYLSGYLYRRKDNLKCYIENKIYSLFIPYCLCSILGFFFCPKFIDISRKSLNFAELSKSEFWDFLQGYGTFAVEPLWFIYCLFFVCIIYSLIDSLFLRCILSSKCSKSFASVVQGICLLSIAYICAYYGFRVSKSGYHLPFHIGVILSAIPFYVMGIFVQLYGIYLKRLSSSLVFIIAFLSAIVFCQISIKEECTVNFSDNELGVNFYSYLIMSICGILSLHYFFSHIFKTQKLLTTFSLLSFWAKNAILILALHWWIIEIMRRLCFNSIFWRNKLLLTCIIILIPMIISPFINKNFPILVGKKRV